MTIQQLTYVLEISKTGSVSRAAKNLYLSQPNISSSIKNLEGELGFTIFERTPMGMQLTPGGMRLVQKAASIMGDIREITNSLHEEETCAFRLVYPRYIPALEAFWDLCTEYQDSPRLRFSCYIGNGDKQVENVYRNLSDVVVCIDEGNSSFRRLCSDLHVKFVELKTVSYQVQMSENHPLLKKKPFDMAELKEYPYVAFSDGYGQESGWLPWGDIVNPDRLICVQSTYSRVSLVAKSNAFSIVLPHSEEYNRRHHVVTVPYDENPVSLGYLYSADRGLSPLAQRYIWHLKESLAFIK